MWWEMHELAEWFKFEGRRPLDTYRDHYGGPVTTPEEEFNLLMSYGNMLLHRFAGSAFNFSVAVNWPMIGVVG